MAVIDNQHCVERASESIAEYGERWDRGEPLDTTLVDLVADLMHWCHERDKTGNGANWSEIEAQAARHFEAELEGVL